MSGSQCGRKHPQANTASPDNSVGNGERGASSSLSFCSSVRRRTVVINLIDLRSTPASWLVNRKLTVPARLQGVAVLRLATCKRVCR